MHPPYVASLLAILLFTGPESPSGSIRALDEALRHGYVLGRQAGTVASAQGMPPCTDNPVTVLVGNMQVVQQGEGWYCDFDGRTYPDMLRRYVMQVMCMDGSGEAILSVFDDQVQP